MHGLANPKNLFVLRLRDEFESLPEAHGIPVLSLLENVGSMPDDVRKAYTPVASQRTRDDRGWYYGLGPSAQVVLGFRSPGWAEPSLDVTR